MNLSIAPYLRLKFGQNKMRKLWWNEVSVGKVVKHIINKENYWEQL